MNPKVENILQVSLEASTDERQKSPELQVGYDTEERKWELIIKYAGNIEALRSRHKNIVFRALLNQYAIVETPIQYFEELAEDIYVELIEKPKRMFFHVINGKRESCISALQQEIKSSFNLYGAGTIVAVIDSGIEAASKEFRNADGTTRILDIWDQSGKVEYSREQINKAFEEKRLKDIPGRDIIGHGTKVATITCGNSGVANKADIVVVKMGIAPEDSFPRTTQLIEAIDYVVKKGIEYAKPIAINISFGNNYGDHTGTSLLERYISDITLNWKCVFCIGSGNEALGATHAGGMLKSYKEQIIELGIGAYETSVNIQIWKEYWDEFDVEIITPSGKSIGRISHFNSVGRVVVDETIILMLYGQPSPYSVRQEIYIDLLPQSEYIAVGIWKIKLIPKRIIVGRYDMWLPSLAALNEDTGFMKPDSSMSCTIPGTAERIISVGAYDSITGTTAPFSGRGSMEQGPASGRLKPDLVAPGVNIQLNDTTTVTGTSFATPFVTGGAALLMEWGIVKGNDVYLYGEKVRAYLIKGARQLPGMTETPNPLTGWGALCVYDSIPR